MKLTSYKILLLATILVSVSAFAQQANNSISKKTLLWQVTKPNGEQVSYLYGTMHSRQRVVFDFGPQVLQALSSCESFAAELKLDIQSLMGAKDMLFLPDGASLKSLLSPAQYDSVATLVDEKLGRDMQVFGRMMPFYLVTLLQESHLMDGEMPYFLDQYLHEYAKQQGLEIHGIETVEEQGKAFNILPLNKQIDLLLDFVRNYDPAAEVKTDKESMLRKYVAMDIEALGEMIEDAADAAKSGNELSLSPEQIDALITKRNQVMAMRIDSLIQVGSLFAAVGAAHLPGKGGLIALLRERGYTVSPVPFVFDGKGYIDLNEEKKSGWISYQDKHGKYRTRFPKKPMELSREQEGRQMNIAMVAEMTGTSFVVNYTLVDEDLAERLSSDKAAEVMDNIMTERLSNQGMNAKLEDAKSFSAYGTQGRQMRLKVSGMLELIMDIRMFVIGDQMYTLFVMQPPASHDNTSVLAFFEAFQPM